VNVGLLAHVRSRLVRGTILVLPALITIWLLRLLFRIIDANVTPYVRSVLEAMGMPGLERWLARLGVPIIGLLLTAAFVYLIGLLAGNFLGRRLGRVIESYILRVPLVKGIYGGARQLLDAFTPGGRQAFSRVVAVEYPRPGVWTIGFVTSTITHRMPSGGRSADCLAVFLPTTPNPTSGWLALVPVDEVRVLDLSVEEGVKLIVSGGIVSPPDVGTASHVWTAPHDAPRA
jgi:uncharacterized membrane protein